MTNLSKPASKNKIHSNLLTPGEQVEQVIALKGSSSKYIDDNFKKQLLLVAEGKMTSDDLLQKILNNEI